MTFDARWRALQREAQLAASLIARGVTVLGKADHTAPGLYAQAFFALSIGLERAGKLVFVADHAIRNAGAFPTNDDLRRIGHDIAALIPICEAVGSRIDPDRQYATKPNDPVHDGIILTLSEFGTRSRYYNLNYIAGAAATQSDPIADWWERVGKPILARHYSNWQKDRDASQARLLQAAMGDSVNVLHGDEAGQPINTLSGMTLRAGETKVVQRYGRLYVLQIARWLGSLIDSLAHEGAYKARIAPLLGLDDAFDVFIQDDQSLRSRKTWSIYAHDRGAV